jgi:nucleoid-associated protein YgaU
VKTPVDLGGMKEEAAKQPEPGDAELSKPKAAPAASGGGYSYTVASGDNIYKISARLYGDGKYTKNILAANPGLEPKKLQPGKIIRVPEISGKPMLVKLAAFSAKPDGAAAKTEAAPKTVAAASKPVKADISDKIAEVVSVDGVETHKVQAGETLGTIAKQYYGSSGPKSIARIVDANKGLNPDKLKVGQEIAIPAK